MTDGEVPDVAVGHGHAGKAELESVMAGIRELPENQRTALLMRELAGHTYLEIASFLEVDEEAVRGLIARARVSLRTHREASELSCAAARESLAADPDGQELSKAVKRHVKECPPCRAYRQALRNDARALRGIMRSRPADRRRRRDFGGLAAKGALLGGALSQVTAACAVSACAVGGVVLLYPGPHSHRPPPARVARAGSASTGTGRPASGSTGSASRGRALAARLSTGTRGRLAGARVLAAGSSLIATAAGEAPRTGDPGRVSGVDSDNHRHRKGRQTGAPPAAPPAAAPQRAIPACRAPAPPGRPAQRARPPQGAPGISAWVSAQPLAVRAPGPSRTR